MHPSQKVKIKDKALSGKRIVIGITGSIAAVETVKLIRELLRHGAEIIPVMTEEASRLIHPNAVEFASGKKPITKLTGKVEHVLYCGDKETSVDLVFIAPATANTISKIACGIDDTPVTTFATTALGNGIPMLISPSMHGSMYDHSIVAENIEKLKNIGVDFLKPEISEGKAKMPSFNKIVENVIRKISKDAGGKLANKKLLVIGGNTAQPIDSMRVITNKSSGNSAVSLVTQAFRRGADIKFWYGESIALVPGWIGKPTKFSTVNDLEQLVEKSDMNYDAVILCAAVSDYSPEEQKGKIKSGKKELTLRMKPTRKIINMIRKKTEDAFLVGYKAESGITEDQLISSAEKKMREYGVDLMVANLLENVTKEENAVKIIDSQGIVEEIEGTKMRIANAVLDRVITK